jgi:hypothetical protein
MVLVRGEQDSSLLIFCDTHGDTHGDTPGDTHGDTRHDTHNSYSALIEAHEMHGRMHPN